MKCVDCINARKACASKDQENPEFVSCNFWSNHLALYTGKSRVTNIPGLRQTDIIFPEKDLYSGWAYLNTKPRDKGNGTMMTNFQAIVHADDSCSIGEEGFEFSYPSYAGF